MKKIIYFSFLIFTFSVSLFSESFSADEIAGLYTNRECDYVILFAAKVNIVVFYDYKKNVIINKAEFEVIDKSVYFRNENDEIVTFWFYWSDINNCICIEYSLYDTDTRRTTYLNTFVKTKNEKYEEIVDQIK